MTVLKNKKQKVIKPLEMKMFSNLSFEAMPKYFKD